MLPGGLLIQRIFTRNVSQLINGKRIEIGALWKKHANFHIIKNLSPSIHIAIAPAGNVRRAIAK
jgi:hypothetical protein